MEAHPAAGWPLSLHILAGERGSTCDPRENGEGVVTILCSLISTVLTGCFFLGSDCFCVPFQELDTLQVLQTPRVPRQMAGCVFTAAVPSRQVGCPRAPFTEEKPRTRE